MINFYPGFLGNNTIDQAIKHLNYIRNLIGTDNIGIGAGKIPTNTFFPGISHLFSNF